MKIDDNDLMAEFKEIVDENPDELITTLSKHPALTDRLHRFHSAAMKIWAMAHGIDKESLREQREAQAQEISESNRQRIKEIQADPIFTDRLHKGHKKLHREYLALHAQEGE